MARVRRRSTFTSCEALEGRRMFATLSISGTSAPDTIVVDFIQSIGRMQVTVNGNATLYADGDVDRFDIFGLGGGDTIDVERNSNNLIWIDAGGGDDTVRFGHAVRNLGTLDADVTVRGWTGTDRIELDDSAVPAGGDPTSYDLMGNVFTRSPFSNPVTFFDVEEMSIACGGRDDFIAVNNRAVRTTVNGNGGNDTLMLATISGDLSIDNAALTTFDGGAGIDEVRANDWAHAANSTYVIDTEPLVPGLTFIGRSGFGGLDTFNNELYLLEAGALHDRIELNGVLGPGASVRVDGNGGIDRLIVAGRTGKLSDVAASIAFDGGATGEANTIELVDLGNNDPTTYTVTATSVDLPGFAHLNYSSDDTSRIELRAGPNVSTINVHATDVDLTLNGGGGDDLIALGGLSNRLSDVRGDVFAVGGGGTMDRVVLFDQAAAAATSATVNLGLVFVDGGFGQLTHQGLEHVTLHTAHAGSTVSLFALDTPLTVEGGGGSDVLRTHEFTHDLARLAGPIVFNGGAGANDVLLDDSDSVQSDNYLVTSTSVTRAGFGGITFSAVRELELLASRGNNTISVESTGPGMVVTVDAGAGNDGIGVAGGGGVLAAIRGELTLRGGEGTDGIVFYDSANTAAPFTTLSSDQVVRPGLPRIEYFTAESLVFEGGSGDDLVEVRSTAPSTTITARGNGGDDRFRVGSSGLAGLANLPARVTVEGGGGTNTGELIDTTNTDNDAFTVTATTIAQPGFGGLGYGELATLTVDANAGDNTFRVNSTSGVTDVRLRGNGGNDFFEVNATHATKPVIIDAGGGSANVINSLPATSAGLVMENDQTLQSLTLMGNARASIAGSGATVLTQFLTVLSGARLDVGRGGVIVNYTGASSPLSAHRAQITSGYNAGLWNGAGIISSAAASDAAYAVGYAEASDVLGASGGTFMGRAVDATAVLIRQTRLGDADLDGTVNLRDFNRIASSFGASAGTGTWSRGDFNYDGLVNLIDFNRLAANFGQSA